MEPNSGIGIGIGVGNGNGDAWDPTDILVEYAPPPLTTGGVPAVPLAPVTVPLLSQQRAAAMEASESFRAGTAAAFDDGDTDRLSNGAETGAAASASISNEIPGGGEGSDEGPLRPDQSPILEALQIPALARSAVVLLRAMNETRSLGGGDLERMMSYLDADGTLFPCGGGGSGRKRSRGDHESPNDDAVGFNMGLGIGLGVSLGASMGGTDAAGSLKRLSIGIRSRDATAAAAAAAAELCASISCGDLSKVAPADDPPPAKRQRSDESCGGVVAEAAETTKLPPQSQPQVLPTPPEPESALASIADPVQPEIAVSEEEIDEIVLLAKAVDAADAARNNDDGTAGEPSAVAEEEGQSAAVPSAVASSTEKSHDEDALLGKVVDAAESARNSDGAGAQFTAAAAAAEEPPAATAAAASPPPSESKPEDEALTAAGVKTQSVEKAAASDDGEMSVSTATEEQEGKTKPQPPTEDTEAETPPNLSENGGAAAADDKEDSKIYAAGPAKDKSPKKDSKESAEANAAEESKKDTSSAGADKASPLNASAGTVCFPTRTRGNQGPSFCVRVPSNVNALIAGRESHTANMDNFERLIEKLKAVHRPTYDDKEDDDDDDDDDDLVREMPFNDGFWSFIRSVLSKAVPVGYCELPNPDDIQPKGPADSAAFLTKFVETSVLNPIHPIVLSNSSSVPMDIVMTELFHAAKVGLLDMNWAPLCQRCGSTACAARRLQDLPRRAYCDGCKYLNDVDTLDKIKVIFSLGSDVFYTPMESFACTPSQASMAANVIFAVVPATSTGSGFRYSAGCGGERAICPAIPPGRYRMHCPVAKTDNFLVVKRDATEEDRPVRLRLLVSDLVCRPRGRRKTFIVPHGKIHFDVYTDTRSFFVLWVQHDLDDGTLLYLPQEERPPFTSAREVLEHPAFQRLFKDQVEGMVMAAVKQMRSTEEGAASGSGSGRKSGAKTKKNK